MGSRCKPGGLQEELPSLGSRETGRQPPYPLPLPVLQPGPWQQGLQMPVTPGRSRLSPAAGAAPSKQGVSCRLLAGELRSEPGSCGQGAEGLMPVERGRP